MADNEYSGEEKRKFKRARVRLTVVYRTNQPLSMRLLTADKEVQATIIDLSEGGMAILTNYAVPASTVLLMRFTLFRGDKEDVSFYGPVAITGEVRYSTVVDKDLYRLGISFTEIAEEDKRQITEFVKTSLDINKK